jgi:hypothetical protein
MSRLQSGSLRSFGAVALCAGLVGAQGCGFWRTVENGAGQNRELRESTLRLRKADRERIVRVVRVDYPLLEGVEDAAEGPAVVVLDLRDFDEVEVYDVPRGLALTSVAAIAVFVVAAGAATGILYLSGSRD